MYFVLNSLNSSSARGFLRSNANEGSIQKTRWLISFIFRPSQESPYREFTLQVSKVKTPRPRP